MTQIDVLRHYGRILAENPASCVFVSMASECMRAGKNKMALEVLEKGLRARPGLSSALTMKGRVLAALGRTTEAREILTRVADSDPHNLLARRILSTLHSELGASQLEPEQIGEVMAPPPPTIPEPAPEQPTVSMVAGEHLSVAKEPVVSTVMEERELDLGKAVTVENQTPEFTETEKETQPSRNALAVETLEKWLNNATKMMKG